MTPKEKLTIEQAIRLIAEYGREAKEFIQEGLNSGDIKKDQFEEVLAQLEEIDSPEEE